MMKIFHFNNDHNGDENKMAQQDIASCNDSNMEILSASSARYQIK